MTNTPTVDSPSILSPAQFLGHWQGHRRLSRRVIEAFPEDQLFSFSIGGMRPFGVLAWEIHQVSELTLNGMRTGEWTMPQWRDGTSADRVELLRVWDELTARIQAELPTVDLNFFSQVHPLPWGEMSGWDAAIYTIDNEIHHRGQGYVFLRALGTEPPAFYER
ncbi:DinB family protein [Deinococcus radiopugnans]|uniref:Damage-inducible protein DinB n=1 Tax=Deinococcus radiopugnans ATCC 19172 TaxID=585398 RepID=A0A5C4Y3U6_9DEIO|nr:DinB family protein [Deinococcus radiopugnans]MBB6017199.1 putative damage-inducible protein DinB [Deinococcus radiopugnans ATCC 19172]TNM70517.1 damage-inducible protein DinB [Deinococcus radiopugnans ATCC 19172]